jgi:hypothetical protein
MTTRIACLLVSTELFEHVLESAFGSSSPRQAGECPDCYLKRIGLDNLAGALGLPEECRVTAASSHAAFDRNQVALRVESPDFREVPVAGATPYIEAFYNEHGFSHWSDEVVQSGYVRHCDRPGYKPRRRWWLRPGGGSWRDRPPLL